jgi:hypothetical protein
MPDVIHLYCQCHPGKDSFGDYENRANPYPFYSIEERKRPKCFAFDCTWPPDWSDDIIPPKVSYRNIYSQETQENGQELEEHGLKVCFVRRQKRILFILRH